MKTELSFESLSGSRFVSLTAREWQVLEYVIDGLPNKLIAVELDISQRTVENHRASIMRKTRTKSVSTLARLYNEAEHEAEGKTMSKLPTIAITVLDKGFICSGGEGLTVEQIEDAANALHRLARTLYEHNKGRAAAIAELTGD